MLKQLRKKLVEWINSDEFEKNSENYNSTFEDKISSSPLIRAAVYMATGGKVVEIQTYENPDSEYYSLYVIDQNQNFCEEFAKILSNQLNSFEKDKYYKGTK